MNPMQTLTLKVWLVLVAALAVFPPFETSRKMGLQLFPLDTNTHHAFVLHREDEVVMPALDGRITVTSINLAALLCELVAVSAVAGLAFISLKDKNP